VLKGENVVFGDLLWLLSPLILAF